MKSQATSVTWVVTLLRIARLDSRKADKFIQKGKGMNLEAKELGRVVDEAFSILNKTGRKAEQAQRH